MKSLIIWTNIVGILLLIGCGTDQKKKRFLHEFGNGQLGAVFGAPDFIDYLNRWAFPEQNSKLIKRLGCYGYEIPEEYKDYPKYNF